MKDVLGEGGKVHWQVRDSLPICGWIRGDAYALTVTWFGTVRSWRDKSVNCPPNNALREKGATPDAFTFNTAFPPPEDTERAV